MRRTLILLAGLLAVSGCDRAVTRESTVGVPEIPETTADGGAIFEAPSGGGPVFQLRTDSAMVWQRGRDLAAVVVYADGRVVRAIRGGPVGQTIMRLSVGTVEGAELRRLQRLAKVAGLDRAASVTIDAAPSVIDGSVTMVIARTAATTGVVRVTHLRDVGADGIVDERARQVLPLADELEVVGARAVVPLTPQGWVVHIELAGQVADAVTWAGPPFAEITGEYRGSVRCAIVDAATGSVIAELLERSRVATDGVQFATVDARPLLPHERTCADTIAGNFELLRPA